MHVLFEEDGAFRAGTVLADAGTTLQVELPSGKRSKIKSAQVMVRFEEPSPGDYLQRAQKLADDIDVDFLWECAPQEEFGFLELAAEYFGHAAAPIEAGGLLMRLHGAPVYFYRKGKGRYRPAPPETLRAALAAVEKKRLQALTVEQWAADLVAHRLPGPVGEKAAELLVRPDKNSLEWKALERACDLARTAAQPLLLAAGAFVSTRELHVQKFRAEEFPGGFGFSPAIVEAVQAAAGGARAGQAVAEEAAAEGAAANGAGAAATDRLESLPLAEAVAFSIDDSTTTEIDDCLSVTTLPDGRLRIGVHIAAPGLGIVPGDALDRLARSRMSTVYMPGEKITMLPPELVGRFSLDAGQVVPALSLYADLDEAGTAIVSVESRAERIRVADNLRHDQLDAVVTEAALEAPEGSPQADALPHAAALRALWRLTLALATERERVRGKPELRGRADYSFYVDGERVRIVERRRDAPLDRIVAEMAILANSRWGRLLADRGAPGIYRSQAMGRVRMSTHPLPHQGLGVPQYAWCTSPLRRYVDLVNQRQILAVLDGRKPPFAPQDAELFSVIGAFDAKYAAYADFQQRMERFWCLRWLAQEGVARADAVVVRGDLVRLAHVPLYFRLADVPELAPGRRIQVDLIELDEIELTVQARFAGLVEGAPEGEPLLEPIDDPGDDEELVATLEAEAAVANDAGAADAGAADAAVTDAEAIVIADAQAVVATNGPDPNADAGAASSPAGAAAGEALPPG